MIYPWTSAPSPEPAITSLVVRQRSFPGRAVNRRIWKLVHDAVIQLPDGLWLKVPEDFEWDLASIPHFLWGRIGPHELSLLAPLVHDWLYVLNGNIQTSPEPDLPLGEPCKRSRREADAIFLQFMLRQQVNPFRARLAHRAVRLFGGRFWKDQ